MNILIWESIWMYDKYCYENEIGKKEIIVKLKKEHKSDK